MAEKCPKCGSEKTRRTGTDIRASGRILKIFCNDCGKKSNVPLYDVDSGPVGDISPASRYVITTAQNATNPHTGFLDALKVYCDANGAQLIVIPSRYRNPTSDKETPDDWWAASLTPYLCGERRELCPGVMLMGDIKTQPTAVNPLSGLHTITGGKCGIFGHTRVALEAVPTPGQMLPKLLTTTGAVTRPNYSDSKAGKKGEFHHVLGAVVLECGDPFHIRHINAQSDGSFIDLDKVYSKSGIREAKRPAAFVMGDLHAVRACPDNLEACKDLMRALKPRRVVLHDVLDFQSASHHNNFFDRYRLASAGRSNVLDELRLTCEMVADIAKLAPAFIAPSNHNEHLFKWLENHNNAQDVENARIYHELKADMLAAIDETGKIPDPLEIAAKRWPMGDVTFIGRGQSLQVHGVEMAYHGDKGPNGARGNAAGFDRIGVKTIIGHSHTPRIVGGCMQVGTSSQLDMGYNIDSPSSWLNSHALLYANGKRTLIHVIGGQWRKK